MADLHVARALLLACCLVATPRLRLQNQQPPGRQAVKELADEALEALRHAMSGWGRVRGGAGWWRGVRGGQCGRLLWGASKGVRGEQGEGGGRCSRDNGEAVWQGKWGRGRGGGGAVWQGIRGLGCVCGGAGAPGHQGGLRRGGGRFCKGAEVMVPQGCPGSCMRGSQGGSGEYGGQRNGKRGKKKRGKKSGQNPNSTPEVKTPTRPLRSKLQLDP